MWRRDVTRVLICKSVARPPLLCNRGICKKIMEFRKDIMQWPPERIFSNIKEQIASSLALLAMTAKRMSLRAQAKQTSRPVIASGAKQSLLGGPCRRRICWIHRGEKGSCDAEIWKKPPPVEISVCAVSSECWPSIWFLSWAPRLPSYAFLRQFFWIFCRAGAYTTEGISF